jgi:hypothetical protein
MDHLYPVILLQIQLMIWNNMVYIGLDQKERDECEVECDFLDSWKIKWRPASDGR